MALNRISSISVVGNAKTASNSNGRPPNLALALCHLRVDHSLCASIDDRASLAATFVNVGAFCAMPQLGPHWAAIKVTRGGGGVSRVGGQR